jgi:ribose transport system substrate-binding protein
MRIWKTLLSTAVAGLISGLAIAQAQEMSDTFRDPALDSMKGKTIAYLPISLGFDMAQAWGGAVKEEANHYGMKFVSQDPNWSTDAMAQALTNLIAQKPDVIVTQNPDLQSLARLLKQANAQGIYVIQVNMQGAIQTDAFVGPDLIGIGEQMGDIVVNSCGKNGKSKKIAIVQGVLTGGVSFFEVQGLKKVLAAHPDIQVVSSQAADWDASKARSITETVLQQNADLCAIVDVWDGQARGTGGDPAGRSKG